MMVCEPLGFSSFGACSSATLRRLPRSGAAKGASKVIRPHAPAIGLQAISQAPLNSVIARFFAFQEPRGAALVSTTSVSVRFVCLLLVSRGGQKLQLIYLPRWLFFVLFWPVATLRLVIMALWRDL